MADYDRRPRRGGGQFNNRKRRYRDDDFEDRRPPRRRYEEPLANQLRRQVKEIAENPVRKPEDDVTSIAKTISENYFDTDLTSGFLDLAVQLTLEQPMKIPFIASIVLLANAQKPEFTTEVLKKMGDTLQKHLLDGAWREVKLLLRFLGCLQALFQGDGVFSILEELFARAADLQMNSSEDALGLELAKVILITIPYTMASSATGFEQQANALLEKTDIIASTPHILENLVDPYPPTDGASATSSESSLSLLQKHMAEEAKGGWELACLPRPWRTERSAEDEEALVQAQKHPFPAITVPESVQVGPRSLFPEIYFTVYTEQDIETVPQSTDQGSIIIRDALNDSINILDYNRQATAKFLIELDRYFAPNTFVKRATPFDKLRDAAGDKNTWKPEDVIVDAAFAMLMQLPSPEHKLVYYHSVLTEACKLAPAAVAPSLGRAIRYLYRNVDKMDLELAQRFLDWFAHHLSNFGFTWKWTEWVDDTELPDVHPKKAFIVDALDKEIRLSFAQRIKGVLPEQYQALIATEKEKEVPDFKFDDESVPFAADAKELSQAVKRRAPDEEVETIITRIDETAAASGLSNPKLASTDAFVQSICYIGSKSLSHVIAVIERCRDRLLKIADDSPASRKQIITSVMEHWRDQTGTGVAIVNRLLNYQVLTPSSVVEWALVDHVDRGTLLARTWCYELVSKTCNKVVGRVHSLVGKIRDPMLTDEERASLQEPLDKEVSIMKALFDLVGDSCESIATGTEDGMMESSDQLRAEEEDLLKGWGQKWVRVFRRRGAVEESWVREEIGRPLPPKVEVQVRDEVVKMDVDGQNGGVGGGGGDAKRSKIEDDDKDEMDAIE